MPQFKHYKQRNVTPGGRQAAFISAWIDMAMEKHRFMNVKRLLKAILVILLMDLGHGIYHYHEAEVHEVFNTTVSFWSGVYDISQNFVINLFG
jgi:hypothetical protein